jgi:hypothetical protein
VRIDLVTPATTPASEVDARRVGINVLPAALLRVGSDALMDPRLTR